MGLLFNQICILLIMMSCGSSDIVKTSKENAKSNIKDHIEQKQQLDSISDNNLIGSWEITTNSPRGSQTNIIEIKEENSKLKGITDNGSFYITQKGNSLSWTHAMDTPMGKMDTKHTATLDGNTINGTIEVISGRAAGRKMNFTGKKIN